MICNGHIQPLTQAPGYKILFPCADFRAPSLIGFNDGYTFTIMLENIAASVDVAFYGPPEIATSSGVSDAHIVGNTLHFSFGPSALHYQIDFNPDYNGENTTITGARVLKSSSLPSDIQTIPRETFSSTTSKSKKIGISIGIGLAVVIIIVIIIFVIKKYRKKPSLSSVTVTTNRAPIHYSRVPNMPSNIDYSTTMGRSGMISPDID